MNTFAESDVESAALGWLESLGRQVKHGPDMAPDGPRPEGADYREVLLGRRLRDALARLHQDLPAAALEDAFRRITNPPGASGSNRGERFPANRWRRSSWPKCGECRKRM